MAVLGTHPSQPGQHPPGHSPAPAWSSSGLTAAGFSPKRPDAPCSPRFHALGAFKTQISSCRPGGSARVTPSPGLPAPWYLVAEEVDGGRR